MTPEWLLVETLGAEPAVVAEGSQTKNLVPISTFLRRNPNMMAIQAAIGETVHGGKALSSLTPKGDRVIRTELVQMTDGRIHGVQVWLGPLDADPPERPVPGPVKWDLANGIATDTPESLLNSGRNPAAESTHGRAFAEDLPTRDLHPREAEVLAAAIKPELDQTFCSTWNLTAHNGDPIAVGFVGRIVQEADDTGHDRLICRAMNWRSVPVESELPHDDLAQRILTGPAEAGVHRALVSRTTWKLLRWLDDPAPFYDWRAGHGGESIVHPDDIGEIAAMTTESEEGPAQCVVRLRAVDGGWTPVHVAAHRVELDENTSAALVSLRVPTDAELTSPPRKSTRRARARAQKAART